MYHHRYIAETDIIFVSLLRYRVPMKRWKFVDTAQHYIYSTQFSVPTVIDWGPFYVCHVSIPAPLGDWNVTHDDFTVIFCHFRFLPIFSKLLH